MRYGIIDVDEAELDSLLHVLAIIGLGTVIGDFMTMYSKGFKPTSDNLASLVSLLGPDETKWAGKVVTIGKQVDDEGGERLIFTK